MYKRQGLGWVGFREVQVFSRGEPEPLPVSSEEFPPSFISRVQFDSLEPITADNAIRMKQLAMLGRGTINQMVWSPDGKTLAVAGSLGVWLYESSGLDNPARLLEGHSRNVLAVGFSPDGNFVFSASQDGTVKKWNVATGLLKSTYHLWSDFSYEVGTQDRTREVWGIAFSPDCTQLATGGFDGIVKLWNISSKKETAILKGHNNSIMNLVFNQDGSILSSIDYDGHLLMWDAVQGVQFAESPDDSYRVWKSVFSPDGKTLLTSSEQSIWLHDLSVPDAPPNLLVELDQYIFDMAFSPLGELLVFGSSGTLQRLDLSTGEVKTSGYISAVLKVAAPPDGKLAAIYTMIGELILFDTEEGRILSKVDTYTSAITSISFNPNGDLIASGSDDGAIRLWNPVTNQLENILWGHMGAVTGVAFSPDGNKLASSSFDGMVIIWDIASGDPISVLVGHGSFVRCVAFSPDGKIIASGSTDMTIRLWDIETGSERAKLIGHTAEVSSVAFSPDGSKLVSAGADFTVRLWDVATGENLNVFTNHLSYVLSSTFSPDGTKLATAGADHYLRVQNASTGAEYFKAKGHGGWVLSTTFSPNGEIVASANVSTTSYWAAPGEIHLYSPTSGFPLVMLRGHTQRVTSIAFSPDASCSHLGAQMVPFDSGERHKTVKSLKQKRRAGE